MNIYLCVPLLPHRILPLFFKYVGNYTIFSKLKFYSYIEVYDYNIYIYIC